MKKLLFKTPEFHLGNNITVRLDQKWKDRLSVGDAVELADLDGNTKDIATVSGVYAITLGMIKTNLPHLLYLEHDPKCRTYEGLKKELISIYGPEVTDHSIITIVQFGLNKRFGTIDYVETVPRKLTKDELDAISKYTTILK